MTRFSRALRARGCAAGCVGEEGRRAAEGRAACSRRGREAPPALAGRGLRLTARALGAMRLRAG